MCSNLKSNPNKELLKIVLQSNSVTKSIAKQIFDGVCKRNKSEEVEFLLNSPLAKMIEDQK